MFTVLQNARRQSVYRSVAHWTHEIKIMITGWTLLVLQYFNIFLSCVVLRSLMCLTNVHLMTIQIWSFLVIALKAAKNGVSSVVSGWIFGIFGLVYFVMAPIVGRVVSFSNFSSSYYSILSYNLAFTSHHRFTASHVWAAKDRKELLIARSTKTSCSIAIDFSCWSLKWIFRMSHKHPIEN